MPPAPQPIYSVQLDIERCAFDIRVNDAPLFDNARAMAVTTDIPANELIRNGHNEITVRLRPPEGEKNLAADARVVAAVFSGEKGGEREARVEVARIEYPGRVAVRREGEETIVTGTFDAQVPFGVFRWFTSPELAATDATRAQLVREYDAAHALLAARNIEGMLALVRERDREHASAYYMALSEQVADTRRTFEMLLDEAEYTLRPSRAASARLRIFGNGRLARLDLSNNRSPVYFMAADGSVAGYVPLVYCRDAAGKWVVVR